MNGNTLDEINLMDYIQVIKKRKWLIIIGTLLCMVVAGIVSFLLPKVYEAKVYLMVTSPKYQVEFATKEGPRISTPIFENISAETFSKIILNEYTARTVLAKLGLDNPANEYTIRKILNQVRVEYPRNTNLILLKVQEKWKDQAAQIANENQEVSALKKQLAEQELIHTRLTRNMDTAKNTFDILSKKGEETKISSAIKGTTIQVSVPAIAPEFPIKPKKRLNVMIAGVVGLLASIMVAFFAEYLEKNKPSTSLPLEGRVQG